MAAADFKAIDSTAMADDRPLSTYYLQRIHESLQYLEDQRMAAPSVVYSQHYYDSAQSVGNKNTTPRFPTWHSATWTCRGPFMTWVPPHVSECRIVIRGQDSGDDVYLAAFSATVDGVRAASDLQRWFDDSENWTNTATGGSYADWSLTDIKVAPGEWNAIWIGIKSEANTLSRITTTDAFVTGGDRIEFNTQSNDADLNTYAEIGLLWVGEAEDSTKGDITEISALYTVAYRSFDSGDTGTATPDYWHVAEHGEFDSVQEFGDRSTLDGELVAGDLGALTVKSVAVDYLNTDDYEPDKRLRWNRQPGIALREIAHRTRNMHEDRYPNLSMGVDQRDLSDNYPGHWRIFSRSQNASWVEVYSKPVRIVIDSLSGQTPVIEVKIPVLWYDKTNAYDGTDSIRFTLEDISDSSSATTATVSGIVPNGAPRNSWVGRWVNRLGQIGSDNNNRNRYNGDRDVGYAWSHDGMTPPHELGAWTTITLSDNITGLTTSNMYRLTVDYQSSGSTARGFICFGDGMGARLRARG